MAYSQRVSAACTMKSITACESKLRAQRDIIYLDGNESKIQRKHSANHLLWSNNKKCIKYIKKEGKEASSVTSHTHTHTSDVVYVSDQSHLNLHHQLHDCFFLFGHVSMTSLSTELSAVTSLSVTSASQDQRWCHCFQLVCCCLSSKETCRARAPPPRVSITSLVCLVRLYSVLLSAALSCRRNAACSSSSKHYSADVFVCTSCWILNWLWCGCMCDCLYTHTPTQTHTHTQTHWWCSFENSQLIGCKWHHHLGFGGFSFLVAAAYHSPCHLYTQTHTHTSEALQ